MRPEDFVRDLYPRAKPICQKNNISTVGCLAQCVQETGWGEHHPNNIWFGIKPWKRGQKRLQQKTVEELDGRPGLEETVDSFVAYSSFEDAVQGYCDFINHNRNYRKARQYPDDWRKYLPEVAKGGYATDPNYLALCILHATAIEHLIYQLGLEA
ncbi:MAG: glycoside hydrolase family 73 protein [Methanocella sp.]